MPLSEKCPVIHAVTLSLGPKLFSLAQDKLREEVAKSLSADQILRFAQNDP